MRMLLALDGSPSSVHARDLVASLPWPAGTAITLLMAYRIPVGWMSNAAMAGTWLADAEGALQGQAADALAALAAPLEGRGWSIDRRVIAGRAATVISDVADELAVDLIVIGSRGHGQIQSTLLGSVSSEIADQARQSVLVARRGGVSRMLVATDGATAAAGIPDTLARWEAFRGIPAVSFSVAPVDSPAFELMVSLYTMGSEPVKRQREELLAQYREHADAMAGRLVATGIPAVSDVRGGDPAHQIVTAAREREVDLVVTGSRALHGLDRLLLGSVARNVLQHAQASVLIVRPTEAPAPS